MMLHICYMHAIYMRLDIYIVLFLLLILLLDLIRYIHLGRGVIGEKPSINKWAGKHGFTEQCNTAINQDAISSLLLAL